VVRRESEVEDSTTDELPLRAPDAEAEQPERVGERPSRRHRASKVLVAPASHGPGAIAAGAHLQGPPTSGRVTKETEAQLLHPRPDREVRRTSVPETQPTDDLRDR
jgi:hypothetical protein